MEKFYVYRTGSNAANQSMTPEMVVSIIEAEDRKEAVEIVSEEQRLGKYTVYNNQRLTIVPKAEIDETDEDLDIIHEDEAMRCQIVQGFCQICGKLVGEMEAWAASNAYCGCRG